MAACSQATLDSWTMADAPDWWAVSLKEANAWWPEEPLLVARWFPRGGTAVEHIFVMAKEGTKSPPRPDGGVAVVFGYAPTTADNSNTQAVLDGGGFLVSVSYLSNKMSFQHAGERDANARGRPVKVVDTTKATGGLDARFVYWHEDPPGDGVVFVQVTSGNTAYSEADLLRFVDRLQTS